MNKKFSSLLVVAVFVFLLSTTARAEIFFAYLEGRQEVPPSGSAAKGYARVNVNESTMTLTFVVVFNNLQGTQTDAHIHAPAAIGTNASVAIGFGPVGGTSGTITGTRSITATQLAQIRAHQGYVNVHSSAFPGGEIRGQLGPRRNVDFDGDGKQDYSVLHFASTGTPRPIQYWNENSTSGTVISSVWGDALRDFPAPGDYDGDGMDDYALYRSGATAGAQSEFWILTSATNTVLYYAWGLGGAGPNPSDSPVARDYDGDGITDVGIVRRGATTGDPMTWYIRRSTNNTVMAVNWGVTGAANNAFYDAPCPGDYDGDGKFDLAIYRFGTPPDNNYVILKSSNNSALYQPWGNFVTDYIAPGDFDGDGKWDFVAARTGATNNSPMVWHILFSGGGSLQRTFGITSDFPVQGDYDGDARADIAVYRNGAAAGLGGNFWIHNSFDNTSTVRQWGINPDFATARFDAR
jgi:CHRD domain